MSNGINKILKRRAKAEKFYKDFNKTILDELIKVSEPKRKRSVIAVHAALIARRKR